jgi:transposase InsO family protein
VEVDAKYIKGMLNDPDLRPNATVNRWIQGILLFDFELVHVPADKHRGPDALSRKELAEDEEMEKEDDSWLDDIPLYIPVQYPQWIKNLSLFTRLISASPERTIQTFKECLYEPDTPTMAQVYPVKTSEQEKTLADIYHFLQTTRTPQFQTPQEKQRFVQKALRFYVAGKAMYKRQGPIGPAKVIFRREKRAQLLQAAHEGQGHRGAEAVLATLRQRFYWPSMKADVQRHVRSCHQCQVRSVKKAEVPIIVSTPSTLFLKIYVDVMFMPQSKSYRCIAAARDDLSGAAEGRAMRQPNSKSMAKFLWEQVFCRYGAVGQVITDNGSEVEKAFTELMDRFGIPQIRISAYNSKANGVVERGHFIIRESILKACDGKVHQWPAHVSHAFFADRVTVRRQTGFSPYYLLHGVHPVLPFDLTEATFMVDGFKRGMTSGDLLALRIRQLQKRPEDLAKAAAILKKHRFQAKEQFEKRYKTRLVSCAKPVCHKIWMK